MHISSNSFRVLRRLVVVLITISLIFLASEESPVRSQQATCDKPFRPVSAALTDLGTDFYTRMDGTVTGFKGGLYPNGSNQPPAEHASAGGEAAARIQPLNLDGKPDPIEGKIGLVAIGMSNTYQEFERFIQFAKDDPEINPRITFVDGAIPGQTAQYWIDPQAQTWQELHFRLGRSKLSHQQVQAAWVKLTLTGGGKFPDRTQKLQSDLEVIARNLKAEFPNLQIAFLSSRTRSYTYWEGLSPEPLAFEGGFAVKWMIEKQIDHDPSLNHDPQSGPVNAPYLAWGPYLWVDGTNPRSDGLVWTAEDLVIDCTHPSKQGEEKVAAQLMNFFKTNPAAQGWFLANPNPRPSINTPLIETESPTSTPEPTITPFTSLTVTAPPKITSTSVPQDQVVNTVRPTIIADNLTSTPLAMAENSSNDEQGNSGSELSIWTGGLIGGVILITLWFGIRRLRLQTRHNNL